LEDAAEAQAKDGVENQLIDKLVELVQAEIPEAMYTNRMNDDVRDFAYRLQSQGLNLNTYLQYTGMNMDGLRQSFRPQAERQVKVRLALEKIAQLENIQPTDEEIEAEYEKLAKNYELDVEKVKSFIPKEELVKDIAVEKAIQVVRDNAVVTEADEAEDAKAEDAKDAE
jgi:trigger factor